MKYFQIRYAILNENGTLSWYEREEQGFDLNYTKIAREIEANYHEEELVELTIKDVS
jgi:hypothetical protein